VQRLSYKPVNDVELLDLLKPTWASNENVLDTTQISLRSSEEKDESRRK